MKDKVGHKMFLNWVQIFICLAYGVNLCLVFGEYANMLPMTFKIISICLLAMFFGIFSISFSTHSGLRKISCIALVCWFSLDSVLKIINIIQDWDFYHANMGSSLALSIILITIFLKHFLAVSKENELDSYAKELAKLKKEVKNG